MTICLEWQPRGWLFDATSVGLLDQGKLDILRDYLDAFTTATKNKASERIYLDLFAGGPDNFDRDSGEPIAGSAEIALRTDDPPFTVLRFFELRAGGELEAYLGADHPGRDLLVYKGDCNQNIHDALDELAHLRWAPTFAFLDPNGPHYWWTTLNALSRFKHRNLAKAELWMLFPVDMFVRFLRTDGGEVDPAHARLVTDMYGTEDWEHIYQARLTGELTPSAARAEYVNLMRWRLEKALGYRWTHTLEVHNENGRSIYHLIFATDNQAGNRIMTHLYGRALREFPRMRRQVVDQKRGAVSLFDDDEYIEKDLLYSPEPPWAPSG